MIWDAKTQAPIRALEGPEDIEWLDWHSKGARWSIYHLSLRRTLSLNSHNKYVTHHQATS